MIEGGERRVESLNFVDVNIKNHYQLTMAKTGKELSQLDDGEGNINKNQAAEA